MFTTNIKRTLCILLISLSVLGLSSCKSSDGYTSNAPSHVYNLGETVEILSDNGEVLGHLTMLSADKVKGSFTASVKEDDKTISMSYAALFKIIYRYTLEDDYHPSHSFKVASDSRFTINPTDKRQPDGVLYVGVRKGYPTNTDLELEFRYKGSQEQHTALLSVPLVDENPDDTKSKVNLADPEEESVIKSVIALLCLLLPGITIAAIYMTVKKCAPQKPLLPVPAEDTENKGNGEKSRVLTALSVAGFICTLVSAATLPLTVISVPANIAAVICSAIPFFIKIKDGRPFTLEAIALCVSSVCMSVTVGLFI